jgi:hypothetical protein
MSNTTNGADTTGKDQPRADLRIEDDEAERIAERLKEIDEPSRPAREGGDEAARNREQLKRELKDEIELPVKGSA